MRPASRRLAVSVLGCALLAPRLSAAACPNRDPGDSICEPFIAFLMPSAAGAAYFPHAAGGPYFGGGVELSLLSWSNNSDTFGPSQGRIRATFTYLAGSAERTEALYRFGGLVSFEGNASRRFLIPYFSGSVGGLYDSVLGGAGAGDASLGLFFVHTRWFVLDGEGGCVFPFVNVAALIGPRAQLTASFALW
jgi:hypothetical protein